MDTEIEVNAQNWAFFMSHQERNLSIKGLPITDSDSLHIIYKK